MTSNIERSRHLDDPGQKKIYDAEVVKVSPGKQQGPGGGDTRENVAGGGRSVTGGGASGGRVPCPAGCGGWWLLGDWRVGRWVVGPLLDKGRQCSRVIIRVHCI